MEDKKDALRSLTDGGKVTSETDTIARLMRRCSEPEPAKEKKGRCAQQ